jgi:hypothetical protein
MGDLNEVRHLVDHAARCWRVRYPTDSSDPVEAEPNQRYPLAMVASYRTAYLFNLDEAHD